MRNRANVCEAFLDRIFSNSGLDDHELLLMLDDKNGFNYNKNRWRACATTNDTIVNMEDYSFREDIGSKDLSQSDEWDTVVYVPKITTAKWKDYKPYFAFVLGHELEHVKVIREKLEFHMCATWLFKHNPAIFAMADIDCNPMGSWDFPLELHCNKKGKKLATDLFGKEKFRDCFNSLRAGKNETPKHKPYLTFVADELKGEPYTKNIVQLICRDLKLYYNKELKTAAHQIWKDEKSKGCKVTNQFDINKFLPLINRD